MFQSIAQAISDPSAQSYAWQQSREDIVTAVEQVFSAVKQREEAEQDLLEKLWKTVEQFATIAGAAYETPILLGAVAAFAPFAAIGAGYAEAAEEIKADRAAIGYAEGLVMGVMRETPANIADYFWQRFPIPNPAFEYGAVIAQYYYNGALVLGYGHGRQVVDQNLAQPFWLDTARYMTSAYGDTTNWGRREWIDFYIATATSFYRGHITQ
jgi:hypothetical protein